MWVRQIRPVEQVSVDQDRLSALFSQLGAAGAEDVVCRALEDLTLRLGQCDRLYKEQDHPALRKNTRMMIAIADQIGMHAVARVARDVTECLDAADSIALSATLARLIRVGDRSLNALWDLNDVPF